MADPRGNGAMELALTPVQWLTVTGMADFLEQKKQEIAARMKQLQPAVDEYQQLEKALSALGGVATATAPTRARRGRAASTARAGTRRRGRPRGTGTRAAQTLELVK